MTNQPLVPAIILDCDFRSQSGVIQSFGRKGIPVTALSSKQDCPAFHSRYIGKKIHAPDLDEGGEKYIDFLLNLPEKGVLVYSNDPCAVAVARHQQELNDAGYLLNISEHSVLEEAFDKWKCYNLAKSLGIPIAKTRLVESMEDIHEAWDDFEKPVILKGTTLAGGMYQRLSKREEIPRCWEKISRLVNHAAYATRKSQIILQEWHQYPMTDNWSCETVYDQHSRPAGFFTIQRIRCSLNDDGTYSSRLFAGHHVPCPELTEMTKKILSKMRWKGFAHVEFFYVPDKKTFMLTEINPRLPGYSYYPSTAGFDLAYYYYCDLVGIPYTSPETFPPSLYFETFHYPGDLNMGILHMLKGNIAPLPFMASYLQLLVPGKRKIVDPIRLDDPIFTFFTQIDNIKLFGRQCYNYIKRRL